jgi:hypothetical protein
MSRSPRSKRVIRLLDSLESVHTNPNATPAERLEAARLTYAILSGRRKTAEGRKRKPAKPVESAEPASKGSDLVPARATPTDILRQFSDLAPVRPI